MSKARMVRAWLCYQAVIWLPLAWTGALVVYAGEWAYRRKAADEPR